ncbi:hypothetical protein [Piscinibacter sp. XHJ-5]|uniref:hypothetical protein n=1 Tax=Piscinibacter sp. XHJ-5 TaxID=3037797 RepID=UPI0024536EDB|nr:hypothetical protein [Piscinibacter sp. XHJ-5]
MLTAFGLLSGCAATSVLTFAYEQANEGQCISAGCASMAMLKHAIDKATEGDPTPCHKLNSVERAIEGRCGPYQPGSLLTKDVTASGLPQCPLTLAAREARTWPVLPELLAKGAVPETCHVAPLVALAQATPCPDFTRATAESLTALRWLAEADARSIDHDVVRMLSCPSAREAGLSSALEGWLAQGQLPARGLSFGVLGALHPGYLDSDFARALEAQGHTARASLGAYAGTLPGGFDLALRSGDRAALDWWFLRAPDLANRVPSRQANQLPWVPLARVITPAYLAQPERQGEMVSYLISRGADPSRSLPHDPAHSVVSYARQLKSPSLALLDVPVLAGRASTLPPVTAAAAAVGSVAAVTPPPAVTLP